MAGIVVTKAGALRPRGGEMARAQKKPSAGTRRRTGSSANRSAKSKVLIDHDEIRRWAEERGAQPARVKGTERNGDDVGIIRLDFPGYTGEDTLEHISWDDWFEEFDKRNLALIVQDKTAGGQQSNFNKLVGRETAQAGTRGASRASRRHPGRVSKAKTIGRASNKSTAKTKRASTRAKRTQSVRGRATSRRKAA
jgi:hypothetical protein